MLTVFNRKELTTTHDTECFHTVCGKLTAAGIPYRTETHQRHDVHRDYGTPDLATRAGAQYQIFVHRDDLDRAQAAIR